MLEAAFISQSQLLIKAVNPFFSLNCCLIPTSQPARYPCNLVSWESVLYYTVIKPADQAVLTLPANLKVNENIFFILFPVGFVAATTKENKSYF